MSRTNHLLSVISVDLGGYFLSVVYTYVDLYLRHKATQFLFDGPPVLRVPLLVKELTPKSSYPNSPYLLTGSHISQFKVQ
jgi:hypothetical protein